MEIQASTQSNNNAIDFSGNEVDQVPGVDVNSKVTEESQVFEKNVETRMKNENSLSESMKHTQALKKSKMQESSRRSIQRMSSILQEEVTVVKTRGYQTAIKEAFVDLDLDKDGVLDREECYTFIEEAARHVKLRVESEVLEGAVDALIEDVGGGGVNQSITTEQFLNIFERNPELLTAFHDAELSQRMVCQKMFRRMSVQEVEESRIEDEEVWTRAKRRWKNNGHTSFWFIVYVGANIAAFGVKAVKYERDQAAQDVFGHCVTAARGSANCLNLNCMLILIPMCRRFLTALRLKAQFLRLPFDTMLEFHIIVGSAICIFAIIHVCSHMCDFTRFASAKEEYLYACFKQLTDIPQRPSDRWAYLLKQRAAITGIIMVFCLSVAVPLTRRRRNHFNTFWYSHHLLLVMLIALCVHGTGNLLEPFQSIYWMMVPFVLYFVPRFWREIPQASTFKVLDIQIKKGEVVQLRMEKPKSWQKQVCAGMYAFINLPEVSRFEWHPFTLTSSPADDYVEINFRRVGDWTTQVYELVKRRIEESHCFTNLNDPEQANVESDTILSDNVVQVQWPIIRVEGPLGAASQGYSRFPVVVLIGAGIGITPMISVLRMLLAEPGKMKRAYFYWTTRDPNAFTWFQSFMNELFLKDENNVLQCRHFLTSMEEDHRDLGAVLLHHATRSKHRRTGHDLILGHRSIHKVDVGRPKWNKEFRNIKYNAQELGHKKCGIFLCGPTKMAESVQKAAAKVTKEDAKFHMYFRKETF